MKKNLNAYRLTNPEDPSVEDLDLIMKEVAAEAKVKNEKATAAYFEKLEKLFLQAKERLNLREASAYE